MFEAEFQKFYLIVGDNIRKEREARGISNEKLAEIINRSSASVSAWQNARRAISMFDLDRVATALHVNITDLLRGVRDIDSDQYNAGHHAGVMKALEAMREAVFRITPSKDSSGG
jgi:transcriptional regulator with XRE-family HTH domain